MDTEPKTPARASFAGLSNRRRDSPSFKDIVNSLMSDREKTFKLAVPMAIANLIVVFLLITMYSMAHLLMPFIRPLSLALLFGSFLHPMKRSLSLFFKQILKEICQDDLPMLASITTPFKIIDRACNRIPLKLLDYFNEINQLARSILHGDFLSSILIVVIAISLVAVGGDPLIKLVIFVNLITFFPSRHNGSMTISDRSLHFLVRSFVMTQAGRFFTELIYIMVFVAILKISLWLARKVYVYAKEKFNEQLEYYDELVDEEIIEYEDENEDKENFLWPKRNDDETSDSLEPPECTPRRPIRRLKDVTMSIKSNRSRHRIATENQPSTRLKVFYEIFTKNVPSWILQAVESYLNTLSTFCVIGLMALLIIITTIYLTFQIYEESVYLLEKISICANTLYNDNPDLPFLPGGMTAIHNLLEVALKDAYEHGREWIRKSIRQLINNAAMEDFNSTQSILIEKQMVEFWDRTYSLYVNGSSNRTGSLIANDHKAYDWERLFTALQSLNFTLCAQILKQNWNSLMSVMDSLSKILQGNLNLALGILTAILSVVVMSGAVVVQFLINMIIFVTALYFLLSSSKDQYIPVALLKNLLPKYRLRANSVERQSLDWVDESINTTFTAFIKIMIYHGLSTWLLHRLFDLKVVFIPSVISAVFGALPFISPFWASVPACIDLCISGNTREAIIMMLLAIGPSSYASSEFYGEIKNAGHPYLTGLAIAGGLIVFGIEGAFFGPILLIGIRLILMLGNGYV